MRSARNVRGATAQSKSKPRAPPRPNAPSFDIPDSKINETNENALPPVDLFSISKFVPDKCGSRNHSYLAYHIPDFGGDRLPFKPAHNVLVPIAGNTG
jgi:hypothetical protein